MLAAVLAVALAMTVAVLGIVLSGDEPAGDTPDEPGPLPLVSIPAPQAKAQPCTDVIDGAPRRLESAGQRLPRRELAEPAPPATIAWGLDNPVVLRCGLDRPPELKRTSQLRVINGVQWLRVPGDGGSATWYVVDRPVYLALTVPGDAGTGPLQLTSDVVGETLPQRGLRF